MKLTGDEYAYLINKGFTIQEIENLIIIPPKKIFEQILSNRKQQNKLETERKKLEKIIDLIEYIKAVDIVLPNTTRKHFNELYEKL